MKKKLSFILIASMFLLVFSLSGCSGETSATAESTSVKSDATSSQENTSQTEKATTAEQSENVLKVALFEIPPYMYKDKSGNATGAMYEYVNLVGEKMGFKVKWEGPFTLARAIEEMKAGSIDCSPQVIFNPEWAKEIDYSEPYLELNPILLVKKDSPLNEIKSGADLKSLKVGFYNAAPPAKIIKENIAPENLELVDGDDRIEKNIQKVLAGRLDGAHEINEFTIQTEAKRLGVSDKLKVLQLPGAAFKLSWGISKTSANGKAFNEKIKKYLAENPFDNEAFRKRLNDEIANLK